MYAFRSPYRCDECHARFWVVSRKTRMGAAAAGVGVAAGIAVAAGLMVLPRYLPTTAMPLDREIEEWSPAVAAADTVLTPKGLAAMVLEPNEVLGGSANEGRPGGGLLNGR